jgi:hypothetical protein
VAIKDTLARVFSGGQPEELSKERQEFVRECADFSAERLGRYQLYENYYDGEQHTLLLERAKKYLEGSGIRFTENVIELVIDSLSDRLSVEGFQVEDDDTASDWLTKTLWASNRMGEKQRVIHTEVPKLGDGFLIVDFNEERDMPRIRWNHPRLIKPVYDDADCEEMLYAVKKWVTSNRSVSNPDGRLVTRLNIFFPDRVEKWFSVDKEGENWAPWYDAEGDPWPTPWTLSGELPADSEAEDPIGIPVVHFRNKPRGRQFGRSEVRGIIPYQAEINKQALDLFYVMDAQGWQWPWVSGVGETDSFSLAIGDVIKLTNPEARAGQLPAADPRPMLEAIEATYQRLAAKSRTPMHDLDGSEPPSGESRKTAESGQVKKAEDRQEGFGNSWSDTMRLAWLLASIHSEQDVPKYDPQVEIVTVWDDAEARNEQAETNMLGVHVELLGVSQTSAMRKLGYDPDEERQLREEEKAAEPEEQPAPEPPNGPKPVVHEPKVPPPSPPPAKA